MAGGVRGGRAGVTRAVEPFGILREGDSGTFGSASSVVYLRYRNPRPNLSKVLD